MSQQLSNHSQPLYGQPSYGQPSFVQPTYGQSSPAYQPPILPPPMAQNDDKINQLQQLILAQNQSFQAQMAEMKA